MGFISSNVISTFCPVYQIKVEEQRRQALAVCDSEVHGAIIGPTSVLLAPDEPHVGPMNRAIRRRGWGWYGLTSLWCCVYPELKFDAGVHGIADCVCKCVFLWFVPEWLYIYVYIYIYTLYIHSNISDIWTSDSKIHVWHSNEWPRRTSGWSYVTYTAHVCMYLCECINWDLFYHENRCTYSKSVGLLWCGWYHGYQWAVYVCRA